MAAGARISLESICFHRGLAGSWAGGWRGWRVGEGAQPPGGPGSLGSLSMQMVLRPEGVVLSLQSVMAKAGARVDQAPAGVFRGWRVGGPGELGCSDGQWKGEAR